MRASCASLSLSHVFSLGEFWMSSFKETWFSEDGCDSTLVSMGLSKTLSFLLETSPGLVMSQLWVRHGECSQWGHDERSWVCSITEKVSPKPSCCREPHWGHWLQLSEVPEVSPKVGCPQGKEVWAGYLLNRENGRKEEIQGKNSY